MTPTKSLTKKAPVKKNVVTVNDLARRFDVFLAAVEGAPIVSTVRRTASTLRLDLKEGGYLD